MDRSWAVTSVGKGLSGCIKSYMLIRVGVIKYLLTFDIFKNEVFILGPEIWTLVH